MFSRIYPSVNQQVRKTVDSVSLPSARRVADILKKSLSETLSLAETAELLEIGRHEEASEQSGILRGHMMGSFLDKGGPVRIISPSYLSSHCVDTCGYCSFSAKRKETERTRLGLEQLDQEVGYIMSGGNRVIEFTLATDPEFTPGVLSDYVRKTARILEGPGSGVLLCSDHLTLEGYKELRSAGLSGMVQWDETLDEVRFRQWHNGSPRKGLFMERMDAHDRATMAGLRVATGILFGLSDYRYDVLMQIAKARYLMDEYGMKPFVFGTPRIKPTGCRNVRSPNDVDDFAYEIALMAYKIAEPGVGRWLQTREDPQMNFRMLLPGDAFTYNCGEVKPGGHFVNVRLNPDKGGQFRVREMGKEMFLERLSALGLSADFAWMNP
ncbi:MAG: hypothetical protein U0R44_02525 [Candidatus Micrarchaeia archaeon]